MTVTIHARQWLITTAAQLPRHPAGASFRTLQLGPAVFLHHHSELDVRRIATPDGDTLILGRLLGDDPDRGCGRYAAVRFPELTVDATGAMGVFCCRHGGAVICGSSTALIAEVTGMVPSGRPLRWTEGINWDPPPAARLPGLRKLYCDQALDLTTGARRTRAVPYRREPDAEGADEDLAAYLTAAVEQVAGVGRPLWLSLTAGRDSRTVFAALVHAGVPFTAFTLHRGRSTRVDLQTARALCERYGIEHRTLTPTAEPNHADLAALQRHTAGTEADAAQEYALGDYYRDLPADALVLHGGVFEVGRRFFEKRFQKVRFSDSRSAATGIAAAYYETAPEVLAPLRAWYLYRRRHPLSDLDHVDLFYLDQRRGGWGAANQQAQDALGIEQLMLANSWPAISLLTSGSLAQRRSAMTQMRAAERLLPGVTTVVPINPPTIGKRLRVTARTVGRRVPAAVRLMKATRRRLNRRA